MDGCGAASILVESICCCVLDGSKMRFLNPKQIKHGIFSKILQMVIMKFTCPYCLHQESNNDELPFIAAYRIIWVELFKKLHVNLYSDAGHDSKISSTFLFNQIRFKEL